MLLFLGNKRKYKIRTDANNKRYITQQKQKVYLSTIRGKYRLLQKGGGWGCDQNSMYMNACGTRGVLDEKCVCNGSEVPIFRKFFYEGSNYEKEIALILKSNTIEPHKLLRVFNVTDGHYDAEKLDLFHCDETNKVQHIRECLQELHRLNIIYVDIKEDNIGYSHIDKRWKLFDFDSSGIKNKDTESWQREAPFYMAYKKAYATYTGFKGDIFSIKKEKEVTHLTDIDAILFKQWSGQDF